MNIQYRGGYYPVIFKIGGGANAISQTGTYADNYGTVVGRCA